MLRSWRRPHKLIALITFVLLPSGPVWAADPPSISYNIRVKLDVAAKTLTGHETIRYISGADTPLSELYLHVYPNALSGPNSTLGCEMVSIYRDYALAHAKPEELGGLDITSLTLDGSTYPFEIDGTSLHVNLLRPLAPHDSVLMEIGFVTRIPSLPGRFRTQDGDFSIAQWYPKMAVYDNTGWHHDQYHLIGEFYGDFATYDIGITLPSTYYIGATGEYVSGDGGDNNIPSLNSDASVAGAHNWAQLQSGKRNRLVSDKTLQFHAENVHDFAWVASPNYRIDETEWHGVKVKALVLARHAHPKWNNLLLYEISALEYYTKQVGEYPYPTLTVAEAWNFPGGAMEYPALAMMDPAMSIPFTHALEYVTIHEVGHNWFYGALANNELDDPWLDEGFAEYFTIQYAESTHKDGTVFDLPGWASRFLDLPYRWTHEIDYQLLSPGSRKLAAAQTSSRFADEREYHSIIYSKGARVLELLRKQVGDSVFNQIMRTYYSEYKFKHVTIPDFVNVASKVSGRNLDSFLDQSLGLADSTSSANRADKSLDDPDISVRIARPLAPFAFADPDHYVVGFNPSIWYNKVDKVRLGAGFKGGYLMTYHAFSGGISYGTATERANYHVSFCTPVINVPEIRIALKIGDDEGTRKYSMDIGNAQPENILLSARQSGAREFPSFRAVLSFHYSDLYDSAYLDPKFYALGKTAVASWYGSYSQRGYQGITRIDYLLAQGLKTLGAESVFTKGLLGIGQDFRLVRTGELILTAHGTVGIMSKSAPHQEQFAIGYGVPRSTVDPIGQFISDGGGGVRGYQNDAVLGYRLFAANFELSSERFHLGLPLADPLLFFDIGRVDNTTMSLLSNRTLCDAGIELRALNYLRLSFPFWLNEPSKGHNELGFRAVARIVLPGN